MSEKGKETIIIGQVLNAGMWWTLVLYEYGMILFPDRKYIKIDSICLKNKLGKCLYHRKVHSPSCSSSSFFFLFFFFFIFTIQTFISLYLSPFLSHQQKLVS